MSDVESAKANIDVYFNNPAGIGDHSNIVDAINHELEKLSHAEDMLSVINKHYPPTEEEKNQMLFG